MEAVVALAPARGLNAAACAALGISRASVHRHRARGRRPCATARRRPKPKRALTCEQRLAVRDLLRGDTTELPSGEAVAHLIGVAPLSLDEVGQEWPHGTPLWFYILKEAEHRAGGDRLGPVGGRIVTEVLIGLLRADPASYLSLEPGWAPTLPAAGPAFGLADLLTLGTVE